MKNLTPFECLKQELGKLFLTLSETTEEDVRRLSVEIPRKWERHGDLIVIPQNSLRDPRWSLLGMRDYDILATENLNDSNRQSGL